MKVKKKYISWSKRLFITLVILSIVVVSGLQGSCASSRQYITYSDYKLTVSFLPSGGSPLITPNISCTNVDTWGNTFFSIPVSSSSTGGKLRLVFPDFFQNLSSDNDYTYHIQFGATGGSSVFVIASNLKIYLNSNVYSGVKSQVSNGDSRYTFDFTVSGVTGSANLVFELTLSNTVALGGTFPFVACANPYSWYSVVTGTDKIINQFGSNYSQPNTDNQDNYNNAESQLIGGVQSTLNGVNSQWNNLNGNLLQYQGAFMAFNRFFNNLTGIPWVGTVITLSVAIGVFALLLGAVLDYVKGTQRSNARESWKAETRRYRGKMLAESQKRRKGK